jgi:hypothetical protein
MDMFFFARRRAHEDVACTIAGAEAADNWRRSGRGEGKGRAWHMQKSKMLAAA